MKKILWLVRTINYLSVMHLTNGVSVACTTLTPEAPAFNISAASIDFGTPAVVIGFSSVTLAPPRPGQESLVTTIAGQEIGVGPSVIILATTTLTPGTSCVNGSGTLVTLDTTGGLEVGFNTIPLKVKARY